MLHKIASENPQRFKAFPEGGEPPPLRPLPQDGDSKQSSVPSQDQLPTSMVKGVEF